jgi:hypothetical protein
MHLVRAARWRRWRRALTTLQRDHDLEPAHFVELAAQLNWGSLPLEKKRRLLNHPERLFI